MGSDVTYVNAAVYSVYPLKEAFHMPHSSTDMIDISMPIMWVWPDQAVAFLLLHCVMNSRTVGSDGEFVKLHDYAISRTGRQTDKGMRSS